MGDRLLSAVLYEDYSLYKSRLAGRSLLVTGVKSNREVGSR